MIIMKLLCSSEAFHIAHGQTNKRIANFNHDTSFQYTRACTITSSHAILDNHYHALVKLY